MRSKRNARILTNDNSKDNIIDSNRKPSPSKIYMNASNNNQLISDSSFQRKGRSIPKDCLGLGNSFQQKLSLPKNQTPRMLSKSGRAYYDHESPNLIIQPKQEQNMEIECLSPTKQYTDIKLPFLVPRLPIKRTDYKKSDQRCFTQQQLIYFKGVANQGIRQIEYQQNQENKLSPKIGNQSLIPGLRVQIRTQSSKSKRTESFEWLQEDSQGSEESSFNQFKQINLGTYYMDNLRKYLKGLNLEGLYAQLYINHFVQQFHSLQLSKQFLQPDVKEIEHRSIQLQQIKAKTLVLDLDETLIHCNEQPQMKFDFKVPIQMPNGQIHEAGISVRPFAQQFLQECSKHFEVMIFTASHPLYADKIIDKLDPTKKWVTCRLYREHCIQTQQGIYVKDLRILNRNLKDVVLIDNAAYSFAYQIDNGIPIIPYIDNAKDNELIGVIDYLKVLLQIEDAREINAKTFFLKQIQQCQSLDEAMRLLLVI